MTGVRGKQIIPKPYERPRTRGRKASAHHSGYQERTSEGQEGGVGVFGFSVLAIF